MSIILFVLSQYCKAFLFVVFCCLFLFFIKILQTEKQTRTYSVAQSTLILEVAPMILCAHGATNNARAVERATLRMRLLSRRLSESFSVRSSVALF